ncbi:TPA_asm: GGDEF domain-containing protein, partial [Listeria monocytogenes]|nr:GGDEF domain-containing protein [Listeria monocytogenes]
MPNILDSLWNSMALFLSALFFHGMALRSIREKKPAWFQIKFANEFINYALGIYYGL